MNSEEISFQKDKKINSYRDLLVWQKALELAKHLYRITRNFPEDERFGLVSQIRRTAVSIVSNIAEGQARRTRKEFVQFLYVSRGSLAELDTQVILAAELNYITEKEYVDLSSTIDALQRMLFRLIESLGGGK